jgi:hypothetical protein
LGPRMGYYPQRNRHRKKDHTTDFLHPASDRYALDPLILRM